ncbi:MAG: PD-(D/E)XK nuclease family protein [Erysipelotrichaceae bacterium]
MKTIICPNYLKNDLINKLLIENNTNYLINTKIVPFNVFINYTNKYSNELLLLKAFKILQNIKEGLDLYKNMVQYPAFIEEIVNFTKELITYNIDIDTLPSKTTQEIELKKIIKSIIDLPFNEKYLSKYKIEKVDNLFIVDYFTNNSFEYKTIKKLIDNGAKLIKLSDIKDSNKKVKFALNNREEIESIAQDICIKENALDSIIVVSNPDNQIPVIKQVFKRYNIPIQNMKYKIKSRTAYDFITISNFILNKDYETLISFLSLFYIKKETMDYIEKYINNPKEILEIPDEDLLHIKDKIKEILVIDKYNDMLLYAYNLLKDNGEPSSLKNIRSIIESTYNFINTKEELEVILYLINKLETTVDDSINQGVLITTINKPVFNKSYTYVIGCSSKLYPGFKTLKGIFDEKYVSNINYPTLEERNNQYFNQFSWIENSSNNIIYSYHISDLSGKPIEGSFELEKYGKATRWDLISVDNSERNKHYLSNETAQKLFFKNNSLYGSVSSFEQFYSCPYKYFVNYGLKIKENREDTVDQLTLGNIVHNFMDIIVKKYNKDYVNILDEEIDEILNNLKSDLLLKHPKEVLLINQLFINIKDNIKTNFIYLKEMELDTSFKPVYSEFKFDEYSINNGEVIIKGSIDRIDIAYDLLRIIDYKTGNISLNNNQICTGEKLQLITYLIVATDLLNKKPMGVYYNSFKTQTLDYKIDINLQDEFIKKNRLLGMVFNEDTTSLSSNLNKFYHNINPPKNHNPNFYIYETFKDGFNKIYKNIYEKLQEGFIDTLPTVNSCTYCPYKSICKYQGNPYALEPVFNLEKGDNDEVE